MVAQPNALLTPEEYLALERRGEQKHEYVAGEIFAMAGASRNHNRIAGDTYTALNTQLVGRPCEAFPSDMRVKIAALGIYTYPDITIACDESELEDSDQDTLLNPAVIIEILSPTTEYYDRGLKFQRYQLIPSLREYLLIAQGFRRVDHHIRRSEKSWSLTTFTGQGDTIFLPTIGCELPLAEVYRRVAIE